MEAAAMAEAAMAEAMAMDTEAARAAVVRVAVVRAEDTATQPMVAAMVAAAACSPDPGTARGPPSHQG